MRPAGGRLAALLTAVFALAVLCACGHKKVTRVTPPPPPPAVVTGEPERATGERATAPAEPAVIPKAAEPIYVETGIASWYGPPYHNRRGANGEIYDMNSLTAAHRTLPLNSVARVTNLQTGHFAMVRITDRGPFVDGRMLDLSLAAAKQVDVWRAGTAKVKLEVMQAPSPIDHGGRWCVQIGAFASKKQAAKLKTKLQRRYRTADILQFTGPTGDWLRIRVKDDDKNRAESLLRETRIPDITSFLVRLD